MTLFTPLSTAKFTGLSTTSSPSLWIHRAIRDYNHGCRKSWTPEPPNCVHELCRPPGGMTQASSGAARGINYGFR
jgi:hypothetical protein